MSEKSTFWSTLQGQTSARDFAGPLGRFTNLSTVALMSVKPMKPSEGVQQSKYPLTVG